MLRRVVSLIISSGLLLLGLWLLYMQLFVWPAITGLAITMSSLLIAIGSGWLVTDFIIPLFPGQRSAVFLKGIDRALIRGSSAIDAAINAARKALKALIRSMVWLAGFAAMLAALACWGFQAYVWLKEGVWTPFPVSAFIDLKETGWVGVDTILSWLFQVNIGIPLLAGGFWVMALSMIDGQ